VRVLNVCQYLRIFSVVLIEVSRGVIIHHVTLAMAILFDYKCQVGSAHSLTTHASALQGIGDGRPGSSKPGPKDGMRSFKTANMSASVPLLSRQAPVAALTQVGTDLEGSLEVLKSQEQNLRDRLNHGGAKKKARQVCVCMCVNMII
jgi:hypothetical protein